MLKKFLKNDKGLTLVELLAVIVILGIIAAIAVPSIGNIIEKSRADAVKSEGIQVLNAAKLFVASEGAPTDNTIDATDIASYMTENSDVMKDGYTVKVEAGNELVLNGEGNKGKVSITFNDASIKEINAAKSEDRTIPAPAPKKED